MKFARRELYLLECGLEALEREIESTPGCTFLGLATGLIPKLKSRIILEKENEKYKDEPYWMGDDIDKWRK